MPRSLTGGQAGRLLLECKLSVWGWAGRRGAHAPNMAARPPPAVRPLHAGGAPQADPGCRVRMPDAAAPCSGHVFANKGIGGTSSGIFTACAEQMVPPVRAGRGGEGRSAGRALAGVQRACSAALAPHPHAQPHGRSCPPALPNHTTPALPCRLLLPEPCCRCWGLHSLQEADLVVVEVSPGRRCCAAACVP